MRTIVDFKEDKKIPKNKKSGIILADESCYSYRFDEGEPQLH